MHVEVLVVRCVSTVCHIISQRVCRDVTMLSVCGARHMIITSLYSKWCLPYVTVCAEYAPRAAEAYALTCCLLHHSHSRCHEHSLVSSALPCVCVCVYRMSHGIGFSFNQRVMNTYGCGAYVSCRTASPEQGGSPKGMIH
jgi:hypothetical protein